MIQKFSLAYCTLILYSTRGMMIAMMMMMMMMSVASVRLLVILAGVLGSIIKGVVCRCLLLGLNISPFSLLDCVVH